MIDHPGGTAATPPLDEELVTFPSRDKVPLYGGEGPQGGVVRDCGIRYLLSCHSRARGPRKHEYVCGVDKAGIGLGLLLVI